MDRGPLRARRRWAGGFRVLEMDGCIADGTDSNNEDHQGPDKDHGDFLRRVCGRSSRLRPHRRPGALVTWLGGRLLPLLDQNGWRDFIGHRVSARSYGILARITGCMDGTDANHAGSRTGPLGRTAVIVPVARLFFEGGRAVFTGPPTFPIHQQYCPAQAGLGKGGGSGSGNPLQWLAHVGRAHRRDGLARPSPRCLRFGVRRATAPVYTNVTVPTSRPQHRPRDPYLERWGRGTFDSGTASHSGRQWLQEAPFGRVCP